MRKSNFLLITLFIISAGSLFAVPAVPWTIEKEQPDGTKILFISKDTKT